MSSSIHPRIGVAGLVLGPLLFSVADLLRRFVVPSSSASDTTVVSAVHDRPGLWLAAGILSLLSALLLVPGIATVIGRVQGRGATLTAIGGYLFGLGVMASIGHMSDYFGYFGMLDQADVSTNTVTRLSAVSYASSSLLIALFLVGMFVGLLIFAIGLHRAGAIPIWAVVAALVAIVVGSAGGVAAGIVGIAAWLATFLPIARAVATPLPRTVVV